MIRMINLVSLVQAQESLSADCYKSYMDRHGILIRDSEVADLRSLVSKLRAGLVAGSTFDGYYVGYRIPQIGKEFDLLRFGTNYNVNIELKSDCDLEKMRRQLLRNRYYLSYLDPGCRFLSYSSSEEKFFVLGSGDALVEMSVDDVGSLLSQQVAESKVSIDERFNPSNYLVSPFNSPDRFLQGQYFLTGQQEDVKRRIFALVSGSQSSVFIALTGAAGTGKTLLAYDIIKEMMDVELSPLIVHCGKLNGGHAVLGDAGWKIISIKDISRVDVAAYKCVLIDEAQRMRSAQFTSLVDNVVVNNVKCMFSYDRSQTLADHETRANTAALI